MHMQALFFKFISSCYYFKQAPLPSSLFKLMDRVGPLPVIKLKINTNLNGNKIGIILVCRVGTFATKYICVINVQLKWPRSFLWVLITTLQITNLRTLSSSRFQTLGLPSLLPSKKNGACSQSSVHGKEEDLGSAAGDIKVWEHQQSSPHGNQQSLLKKEGAGNQPGWLWTAGTFCSSALWVKQKQSYRSTRPWWPGATSFD